MMRRFFSKQARRIRAEDSGMTLVELMTTISLGMVITFAGYAAIEAATKMQTRTEMRVEAIGRGRNGMESIIAGIRAQQCNGADRPMLWASDTGMEFYSSIAPLNKVGLQQVERRRLEWLPTATGDIGTGTDPANTYGDIWETVWRQNPTTGAWPARTAPLRKAKIATGVKAAPDRRDPTKTAPIFRYFKYAATTGSGRIDVTAPVPMNSAGNPTYNTSAVKSAAETDLSGIVLVEVGYQVVPRRTRVVLSKPINFYNTVSVRIADPTNPAGSPQCL